MMQKQFPISVAKNNLPSIIQNMEKDTTVELTKYGKPVAVLVSILQYQELVNQKKIYGQP